MLRQLTRLSPEELRAQLIEQIYKYNGLTQPETSLIARRALSWLFKKTRVDLIAQANRVRGKKGSILRKITVQRTGQALAQPPDVDGLIENAQAYRVL
jgi:hypothetical protein